eukprot:Gb_22031 [translate_table: standard]
MLLKDPHFVRLLDVEHKETKFGKPMLFFIFEYLKSDLKNYIYYITPLTLTGPYIYYIIFHLSRTIMPYLWRELKPSNLLVNKEMGMIKIIDLGLGRAFTIIVNEYTHEESNSNDPSLLQIMTLLYRAPKVLQGATHYSTSINMWSVGCIFAKLYILCSPFHQDSELQQILHIFKLLRTPSKDVWSGVIKLNDWHEYP